MGNCPALRRCSQAAPLRDEACRERHPGAKDRAPPATTAVYESRREHFDDAYKLLVGQFRKARQQKKA